MNYIGEMYRLDGIQSRTNGDKTYYSRTFAIIQRKYDMYTGEEQKPNYVLFEMKGENNCNSLDSFAIGTKINVTFALEGSEYEKKDKATGKPTGEKAIFSKAVALKVEPFAPGAASSGIGVLSAPAAPAAPVAPSALTNATHTKPAWASNPNENPGEEDDLPFD